MTKIKPKPVHFKLNDNKLETIKPPKCLERITTIHGINYFRIKRGRRLITWALLMTAQVFWTVIFLIIIRGRYNKDETVTKIYSNWSVDKVPFPAVSLCNYNLVSRNESKTIVKILHENNITDEEIEFFFQELHFLVDFDTGSLDVRNHSKIMDILKIHYYSMNNIMEEVRYKLLSTIDTSLFLSSQSLAQTIVHQKCKNLLVYCQFNGKAKNCDNIFSKIQTLAGYCCTFNFNGIDDEGADPMMSPDEDFEYYIDRSPGDGDNVETNIIATAQSGSSSGLRVVFNVEPEDYVDWSMGPAYGAKVFLSDPNDFAETRVLYRYLNIGESLDLKVEPMIYECEANLRYIDIAKRGCWFHDEVTLVNTNRYSYETCSTECKISSYKEYCGCIPYKYPAVNWEATKLPCVPECYKECRDKSYTVITDTVPFLAASYPVDLSGRNESVLAAVHVYYINPTCNCYMMTLLSDTNTFIATYGGIFSLCFGASIITIWELAYLCSASLTETMRKIFLSKFKIR